MVGSQEKGGKKNIILNCVKDLSISQEYVYSIEKKKKKRTPKEFHCSFFSLTLVYAEKILTTHEKQPCLLCLQSNIVDVILKNNRKYFFQFDCCQLFGVNVTVDELFKLYLLLHPKVSRVSQILEFLYISNYASLFFFQNRFCDS